MIRALLTGSLYGDPQARTSQAGKPFTTAKLRADGKDGDPASGPHRRQHARRIGLSPHDRPGARLMTPFATLILLKDTLAAVDGVASCRIGLEANITPADYPLIRIVPTRLIPSSLADDDDLYLRQMEVLIYFGAALLEASDGLEAVYEELLTLEAAINAALNEMTQTAGAAAYFKQVYVETITDEDRLPHYKLFASRWRIEG